MFPETDIAVGGFVSDSYYTLVQLLHFRCPPRIRLQISNNAQW